MNSVLFVLPRTGHFLATICQQCGHVFRSNVSDTTLVTFRNAYGEFELIDPTTQEIQLFPSHCPTCGNVNLKKTIPGIPELYEKLLESTGVESKLFASGVSQQYKNLLKKPPVGLRTHFFDGKFTISSRIYDPAINYSRFTHIVLLHSNQYSARADYQTKEEVINEVTQLILELNPKQHLLIDGTSEGDVFRYCENIQKNGLQSYTDIIRKESEYREIIGFPPYGTIFLFTAHERKKSTALKKLHNIKNNLTGINCTFLGPYPAKMLRRKGLFTYHLVIKIPRKSKDFTKLRIILMQEAQLFRVQLRKNPRTLF